MTDGEWNLEGGCACGVVRYRLTMAPMFTHCCHCRDCQRQTGAAFALNAMVEAGQVEVLQGRTEAVMLETPSGGGQEVHRCPTCRIALWSHYLRLPEVARDVRFLRVGTLDEPDAITPDIHIFTASKHPWVTLPDGARAVAQFYDFGETWPLAKSRAPRRPHRAGAAAGRFAILKVAGRKRPI